MKNLPIYISLLLLLTCAKEDSQAPNSPPTQIVKQYTLTAIAGDGGSISGGGTFTQGTQVSLTATPNSGYSFSGWSNGSTTNPLTVTLNSNTSITANFQEIVNSYTITLIAEGGVVTGAGEYDEGTEVILTATANEGYVFNGWEDSINQNPRNLTVNEDLTLTANFISVNLYFNELYSNSSIINDLSSNSTSDNFGDSNIINWCRDCLCFSAPVRFNLSFKFLSFNSI